jgi:multidrug efflux pump subunit AcrB
VRGLDGVKKISSTASEGMGSVSVELLLGADENKALADIKNTVDRITTLPEDAERPTVSLASMRRQVLTLVLHGPLDPQSLHALGEMVREDILARGGVTQVDLSGVKPLEIAVEITQERLRAHGLTIAGVAEIIRRTAVELPGGGVRTRGGEILLRMNERRDAGADFAGIPIISRADGTVVTLGDLATIRDGFAESDAEVLFFGRPALKVEVYAIGDETPIGVSDAVKAYLAELEPRLPAGVEATIWQDWSDTYRDRLNLLLKNAALGFILVFILLGVFLEVHLAFWVTLGIPISIFGSFLIVPATDVTINMLTLFAFIVTLGIVVDDAIVVGENVYEKRQKGLSYLEAAIEGTREITGPVSFSVITNIVAFVPLLFVSGMMGKFFAPISLIVIPVFVVSLIESLYILPAHLAHSAPPRDTGWLAPIHHFQQRVARKLERLIRERYGPILKMALEFRYTTVAIAIAVLVVVIGFVAGGHINFSFMPKIESDAVTATATLPYGTHVSVTRAVKDRLLAEVETILERNGGRKITLGILSEIGAAVSGGGAFSGGGATGSHIASVRVFMVPVDQRPISAAQLTREWREAVGEIAGLESLTFKFTTGPGAGSPINLELQGADIGILERAAADLAEELGTFAGVKDVNDGVELGKTQFDLTLTPEGRAAGFTVSDLGRQIRNAFYGAEALRQQRGRNEVKVMVKIPESDRVSERAIEELMVRTPRGGEMPLGRAAEVRRGRAYTSIRRVEGRRVMNVTADVEAEVTNADKVLATLQAEVLPRFLAEHPGVSYGLSGETEEMRESMTSLLIGFVAALFAIYVCLAIPFNSYWQPVIVMVSIPFGIIGAVLGHMIMGYEISLMSAFGVVALAGVVVNDSLVLVHTANESRARGEKSWDAVYGAGIRRFRPVMLTSLTTFLGLAPMIMETSLQARFLIPMAISLGFGILFATGIVLFLLPALYLVLVDVRRFLSPEN